MSPDSAQGCGEYVGSGRGTGVLTGGEKPPAKGSAAAVKRGLGPGLCLGRPCVRVRLDMGRVRGSCGLKMIFYFQKMLKVQFLSKFISISSSMLKL